MKPYFYFISSAILFLGINNAHAGSGDTASGGITLGAFSSNRSYGTELQLAAFFHASVASYKTLQYAPKDGYRVSAGFGMYPFNLGMVFYDDPLIGRGTGWKIGTGMRFKFLFLGAYAMTMDGDRNNKQNDFEYGVQLAYNFGAGT